VKSWSNASPISLSFGYEISSNLLQLAQAFTVVANQGCLVKPAILYNSNIIKSKPLYSIETIDNIKKILFINEGKTKLCNKFYNKVNIFGKTGTARLLTNGKYDPTRLIFTY